MENTNTPAARFKPGKKKVQYSKSDVLDHRVKVIQCGDASSDVYVRYYDQSNKDEESTGYNYHDFDHQTWYDYTRNREPLPPPVETMECDDIFICLPFHSGVLRSLVKCSSGVTSGWGFTSSPRERWKYYFTELTNGILCGMTMLPEIISFSFLAGVPPHVALHGTWIVCICAAVFGGSPGIMSGVSGAFAAVAGKYALTMDDPLPADIEMHLWRMLASIFLAGVVLMFCSYFHLASISQYISTSVIIGYSNGLAIVIARAQLHGFLDPKTHHYQLGARLAVSITYCLIAFALMQFTDKIPKIGKYLPPALLVLWYTGYVTFNRHLRGS